MKKSKKKYKKISKLDDPLAGDLSELMLDANWQVAKFELTKPKTETITLRVSKELLNGIKSEAYKSGLEYQKFMRILMENYLRKKATWNYK